MKVCVTYKLDSIRPLTTLLVECWTITTQDHRLTFFHESEKNVAFKSIDLDQIAEYHVIADFEFETLMEKYLSENGGSLEYFYKAVSSASVSNYGRAFYDSLSMKDQVRIKLGSRFDFADEKVFDGPKVLFAISFLENSTDDYPDTHPLNSIRFSS
jgi:hypothetical protein